MKFSNIEKFALGVLFVGVLAAGCVDSDNVVSLPDYSVNCEHPENSGMCQIVNKDGDFVADISFEEASDAELFKHPESIQNWLDTNTNKYEVAKEVK